jgi:membrane protease YdiL (CAAX protease family)
MTTASMATRAAVRAPDEIRQLSGVALIALHLVPGALMTVGFVALAPLAQRFGFPPIAALLGAILLVLVPVELGLLAVAARRDGTTVVDLISYRRRITGRTWAWLVPSLIVLAFLGFGLHQAIEPALIDRFFGWLPGWYVRPIVVDRIGDYSATAWIVTIVAYFALNGFVGPIVEELYFRGYLLPRMERFGRWAPLLNVSLFSIYHFWSPWQIAARILGLAPTVYAVRRTRNVVLGMVVHCSLNTLGVALVASMILARI